MRSKFGFVEVDSFITTVGNIAKVQGGYAFKSDKFIENGIPVIRISNISENKVCIDEEVCYDVDFWDEHPEFRVNEGDILIAMSGATVGKTGIYSSCCLAH